MCLCCRERKFCLDVLPSTNKQNTIYGMINLNSCNLLTAQYHRLTPVDENECNHFDQFKYPKHHLCLILFTALEVHLCTFSYSIFHAYVHC